MIWTTVVWVQQPNGGWVLWALKDEYEFLKDGSWATYRCELPD